MNKSFKIGDQVMVLPPDRTGLDTEWDNYLSFLRDHPMGVAEIVGYAYALHLLKMGGSSDFYIIGGTKKRSYLFNSSRLMRL